MYQIIDRNQQAVICEIFAHYLTHPLSTNIQYNIFVKVQWTHDLFHMRKILVTLLHFHHNFFLSNITFSLLFLSQISVSINHGPWYSEVRKNQRRSLKHWYSVWKWYPHWEQHQERALWKSFCQRVSNSDGSFPVCFEWLWWVCS